DDRRSIHMALHVASFAELQRGHLERAESMACECVILGREIGATALAAALGVLGDVRRRQGRMEEAWASYRESLVRCHEMKMKHVIADTLEKIVRLEHALARLEGCARLHGAASALREEAAAPLPTFLHPDYGACVDAVRAALGEEAFARAFAEGRGMDSDQAV